AGSAVRDDLAQEKQLVHVVREGGLVALDVTIVQGHELAGAHRDSGFFLDFAFDCERGRFEYIAPAAGQSPPFVAAVADEQDAALVIEDAASDVDFWCHVSLFEEHVLLQVLDGAVADEGEQVRNDLFGLFVALPVEDVGGEDEPVVREGGQWCRRRTRYAARSRCPTTFGTSAVRNVNVSLLRRPRRWPRC
ncbi:hypothetical protein, partial [Hoeflea sp.]|uniref:hypothetical protein n=1 Tax=Hoeflea sp. TaxID=1940281 RepID=UPI0025B80602